MKFNQAFIHTLREDPKEAAIVSHKLLLKASMILRLASGIYTYLPLGFRVIEKVNHIVSEEMNRMGAIRLLMPFVQPRELWEESGRWKEYGKELLRIKDRGDRDFAIGPTHEEIIVDIVRHFVKSYKDLPLTLYQIQTKFRDEIRPRFGLMRGREFIMKDAYSFGKDEKDLEKSFKDMFDAYCRILKRCGLKFRAVEADTGLIGGKGSLEFMVPSSIGEDEIICCNRCSYAANIEKAKSKVEISKARSEQNIEKVHTPKKKTVEEVSRFVGVKQEEIVKTLIYKGEKRTYAFLIRGCDELNPIKAKRAVEEIELQPLIEKELKDIGLHLGFLGPIELKEKNIYVLGDNCIKDMEWCVIGANEKDFHLKGAKIERDFSVDMYADLRKAKQGESCPVCNGKLDIFRGIELGHVFKLGDKYSRKMNGYFLDEKGKKQYYIMGCYGVGIGRTAQAIVEMHHDEKGIIWPLTVAPYDVEIISLTDKDYANLLHDELEKENIEVLLDDRKESPGVKFADCDLIGIPIRIVLGKYLKQEKVEVSLRKDKEKKFLISKHEVVDFVKNLKQELIKEIENE